MKLFRFKAVLAALGIAMFSTPAPAQDASLVFATLNVPGIPINSRFLHPWADGINKDGTGKIQLQVRDGYALANFGNVYQRVLSDAIQVAFALQPPVGGKFLLSEVAGLPFITDNSADASAALWRLYETGMLDAEYKDIQPLALVGLPQGGVHLTEATDLNNGLSGKKVLVANKIQGEIIVALGGTPQALPLTAMYEALKRGTVNGTSVGWPAFPSFKLFEVTNYHIEARLGASTAMLFMSKKRWDGLTPAARDVLRKNMGENVSRKFGEYWDWADVGGRKMTEAKGGHTIVELTDAQKADWHNKAEPLLEKWAASRPNGAAVKKRFQEILAAVKAGK